MYVDARRGGCRSAWTDSVDQWAWHLCPDCAVLRQIGKCLEPTWNEEFRFRLPSQSPRLTVYVMDQNVVFDDQEIGRHGCMLCATEASLS